jgi:hypothetical protein
MNILQTIKRKKPRWICHVLHSNCLLEHVIEGKIEESIVVTGGQRRGHRQLQDDLKDKKGCWKFKEEALDLKL